MDHFYGEAMRLAEELKQGRVDELPKGIGQDGSVDPWPGWFVLAWGSSFKCLDSSGKLSQRKRDVITPVVNQ